jgi:hypothetical protein
MNTSAFNSDQTFHRKLIVHIDNLHLHTSLELPLSSHLKHRLAVNQFRDRETFLESVRDVLIRIKQMI